MQTSYRTNNRRRPELKACLLDRGHRCKSHLSSRGNTGPRHSTNAPIDGEHIADTQQTIQIQAGFDAFTEPAAGCWVM